ncbi:FtsX-like permease family protein [Oceanobacillus neutriphilus]|uniref:Peptide ABC transporter permease n=1 Tax=Oceanobacillus neutriphilus TaxID=531815 RepID=A0ABQ2P2M9_9BACI|nr:ABC transporter permease [Oceanobacillus neutriphilus]GGP16627.1 peptide ABC transporter permease [Oceanobacillus neutriphilus]
MSFSRIVWKMAKANYKKYIFYYLCNTFAVMFFFIFSTIYFNRQVDEVKISGSIQYLLIIPGVTLVLFTILFISYAHQIFIKQRRSEFGLFITLGMTDRDIVKLVLLESTVIGLLSLTSGIIGGMIFSKGIFFLLMYSVGIGKVAFHLSSNMFLYTVVIFIIIFMIAIGRSLYLIFTQNVITNIKSKKTAAALEKNSPVIGGIGAAFVILSIIGVYFTYAYLSFGGELLYFWAICTILGVYISLNQFISLFIEYVRKKETYYYPRMLFLTNINYKFKHLTTILTLVISLVMVTVLYGTLNLSIYSIEKKEVLENKPYDIAFLQTETKNNLDQETVYSIIDQEDNRIQEYLQIPVYTHYERWEADNSPVSYSFMPAESFRELTSKSFELESDEMLYYINFEFENSELDKYYWDNAARFAEENLDFNLKEIIAENDMNVIGDGAFFIINHLEFEQLENQFDGYKSVIHQINVEDWRESEEATDKLEEAFQAFNKETPPIMDERTEGLTEEEFFKVGSKIKAFQSIKIENGISFFVMTALSIIFFFGSFILLYLNLFSEIENEKEKYRKLHAIGITDEEVKQNITKEIRAIFFMPAIIGVILAFGYFISMMRDIGGIMANPGLLLYFSGIAIVYLLVQFIFYMYARKKIIHKLM